MSMTENVGQPTEFLINPLGHTGPPCHMALDTSAEYVISKNFKYLEKRKS